MSANIKRTKDALGALGIKDLGVVEHEAVKTGEAHQKVAGSIKGNLALNLVVKDKKGKVFLVTGHHATNMNFKVLAKKLNAGGGSVRMLEPETMQQLLGVEPGCVTPLAVMNDKEKKVFLVLDKALESDKDPVNVHCVGSSDNTISIMFADVVKFAKHYLGDDHVSVVALAEGGEAKEAAAEPKKDSAGADNKKAKATKPAKDKAPAGDKPASGAAPKGDKAEGEHKEPSLGIEYKKSENFAMWYSQVVTKSEMIEYYDISGCYILRPWSFAIWEAIQRYFDAAIVKSGVKNSYFPLFVSSAALNKEKDHVKGFAPEVAWVTKAGKTDLDEHIAVRPTSETIMYPAFAKWIRSHRDMPMRLNQWSNVVRWEFKKPTPFIRSREFLWQEGHSAFATKAEADIEVLEILELYRSVYEDLLAVPVIKGKKTEEEKFAGGDYTTTVEAFIPAVGRGIQGATSHGLGQNFSRMFGIEFEDQHAKKNHAWQNSWGLTTRTIGVMVMVHADDKGLVLPPRVAPLQVVIVPVYFSGKEQALDEQAYNILKILQAEGVRAQVDDRKNYNPGWKYNNWELRGVPLRIELGPKDLAAKQVVVVQRHNGKKATMAWADLATAVPDLLATVQAEMLINARQVRDSRLVTCHSWADFMKALDKQCIALVPWCGVSECEVNIKERSGQAAEQAEQAAGKTEEPTPEEDVGTKLTGAAKSLCIPFEQRPLAPDAACVGCGKKAINYTLFGRSY